MPTTYNFKIPLMILSWFQQFSNILRTYFFFEKKILKRAITRTPQLTSYFMLKHWMFSPNIKNKKRLSVLTPPIPITVKVSDNTIRQEKEILGILTGKEEIKLFPKKKINQWKFLELKLSVARSQYTRPTDQKIIIFLFSTMNNYKVSFLEVPFATVSKPWNPWMWILQVMFEI